MFPASFEYVPARSLEEAGAALAEHGGDARVLAGGQSLIPAMRFRLARPAVLVDINRIPDLDHLSEESGSLRIGALCRDYAIERVRGSSTTAGALIDDVSRVVADPVVRQIGTVVGSHLPQRSRRRLGRRRARLARRDGRARQRRRARRADRRVPRRQLRRPPSATARWRSSARFPSPAAAHGGLVLARSSARSATSQPRRPRCRCASTRTARSPRPASRCRRPARSRVRVDAAEQALVGQRPSAGAIAAAAEAARAAATPQADCAAASSTRRTWRACSSARAAHGARRDWGCRHEDQGHGQRRRATSAEVEPRTLLAYFLREELRADRHARRLRHVELRLLRRRARRRARGQVVHDVRRAGRRPRDHDRRGARRGRATLHPLQQAFWDQHGLQCGYCTPGMLMTVVRAARSSNPSPTEAEIREGLCRQPLPMHRLPEHRQGGAAGRRQRSASRLAARVMRTRTAMSATKPVHSMGMAMKRKEDPRFIQGKGNYVDDVVLPGMPTWPWCAAPIRTPTIKSIDISEATEGAGRLAVITGKDLEAAEPRLAADVPRLRQADGAGRSARCSSSTRRSPRCSPRRARRRPTAPSSCRSTTSRCRRREPVRGREATRCCCGPTASRRRTTSTTGRSATRATPTPRWPPSEVVVKERIWFQRCHPAPLEPCGCVAEFDTMGRLNFYVTSQAPHVYRTALTIVTGIPEDKIRVDLARHRRRLRQQGAGLSRVRLRHRRRAEAAAAGQVDRDAHREPDESTGFARDYHMDVELGASKDGTLTALTVATTADHGAFDAAADPTKYPAGMFGIVTGSYDFRSRHAEVDAYFTNKAPGGVAYRCSFRVTEASFAIERGDGHPRRRARAWTRPTCA